jgi:hypothetical protein
MHGRISKEEGAHIRIDCGDIDIVVKADGGKDRARTKPLNEIEPSEAEEVLERLVELLSRLSEPS